MNIIDTIRVSGTDYTLSATSSGGITSGEVQTMIDESVSGITERMAEDEEVTAAALNNLNDRISGISGNNAVEVTQAEYDALVSGGTVDPTAFYIITDATPVDISNYWTSAQTNSAINAAVSGKVDTSSVVTAVTSGSTDSEIPTAKAVFDAIPTGGTGGGKAISAGTNISVTTGETADTIDCTLPITNRTNSLTFFNNSTVIGNSQSVNFGYSNSFGLNPTRIFNFGDNNSTPMYGNYYYVNFGDHNSLEGYGWDYTFGRYLKVTNQNETAFGKYNKSNTDTLFSIGNGTGSTTSARHNAFEIRQNGDIYLTKDGQDVKLQDQLGGGGSITVDSALSSTSENPVQNKVIYNKFDEVEQVTARALNELNDAVSGKVDTSTFNTFSGNVETALSGKQDTLSAGTGIDITNNVISATGGGGGGKAVSGGTNISITTGETADTVSCTLPIREGSHSSNKGIIVGDSECSSTGSYSISFGHNADAGGSYSLCMGSNSSCNGQQSIVIGDGSSNKGSDFTYCFGSNLHPNRVYQFLEGANLHNNNEYEVAFGQYNVSSRSNYNYGNSGNTLFSIGNGYDFSSTHNWHNALEIRQNGDIYVPNTDDTSVTGDNAYSLYPMVRLQDTITATAANTTALGGLKLVKLSQSEYDSLATKDNSTLYVIIN